MGHVYASVEIQGPKASKTVKMLVNTGATYLMIPPKLSGRLGIVKFPRKVKVCYADVRDEEVEAGLVTVKLKNRTSFAVAIIRECKEPLLGTEALEALGFRVDLSTGRLQATRSYAARM